MRLPILSSFLFVIIIGFQSELSGQCTPGVFTDQGFYPAAIPGLETTTTAENTYSVIMNYKSNVDTLFGGFNVSYDSIVVTSIMGLPTSFSVECQNPNCSIMMISSAPPPGSNTLCWEISGNPSMAAAGVYPLTITIQRWITVFGFPLPLEIVNTDYTLVINSPPAIPTLSQWGTILLLLVMLVLAMLVLRKKTVPTT